MNTSFRMDTLGWLRPPGVPGKGERENARPVQSFFGRGTLDGGRIAGLQPHSSVTAR